MKPKQWYESRTDKLHIASAMTAVVAGLFAAFAPGKVSVETAGAIASLLIFAARGAWLKADDRSKQAAVVASTVVVSPEAFAKYQEAVNRPAQVNDRLMAALVAADEPPKPKATVGEIVAAKPAGKVSP